MTGGRGVDTAITAVGTDFGGKVSRYRHVSIAATNARPRSR
jgi:hypothetical protein